jgi:hypothetical protein
MMRRILFLTLILAALSPVLCAQSSFTVPWGDAPDRLGLVSQHEQERVGPLTFAVSPAGSIVVADTVHRQVKEWTPDGKYNRTLLDGVRPSSMAFDSRGNLLLLDGHQVLTVAPGGKIMKSIKLPGAVPLVEGYAQEVFEENGAIGVNDPDQLVYLFDPAESSPTTATTIARGRQTVPGKRAYTSVKSGVIAGAEEGEAKTGGREVTTVAMSPSGKDGRQMGAVVYRGLAGKAATRVFETEEIEPGGVRLILRAAPDNGIASIELQNSYFTTVYRKFDLLPDGVVWQMQTTDQGVVFTRIEAFQ